MDEHERRMDENERDLVSRYAYGVSQMLLKVGWCALLDPTWTLPLSCGRCAACRVRNLQQQVETLADGPGAKYIKQERRNRESLLT